ncbi:MAG: hypothetical protein V1867_05400 [Candidatus Falkowbacteria bacterium]
MSEEKEKKGFWLPSGFDTLDDDDGWIDLSDNRSKKYPGFRSVSECRNESVFTNGRDEIVEVYGEQKSIMKNGQAVFAQDCVAVLRESDAELYWKLQWPDWWRWHGDVASAKLYLSIMIGMLLFIGGVFAGAWIFWPPSFFPGWILIVAGAFLSAAAITVGKPLCWRLLRIIYGILNVWTSVWWNILKSSDKNRSYYRNLLRTLAGAHCRDKSRAAAFMAKLI